MPPTQTSVCSVTISIRKAITSLASGNAREAAAVRVGVTGGNTATGVLTCLMNDYRAFAKHLQKVFRSLQRFCR